MVLVTTYLGVRFGINSLNPLWFITPKQQTLYIDTNILKAGNFKSLSGQLQNNTVKGALLITVNPVIIKKQPHLHETSFPNILHYGNGRTIKNDQLFTNPVLLRIIVDVPKIE